MLRSFRSNWLSEAAPKMQFDFTNQNQRITVAEFVEKTAEDLELTVIAGKNGLGNKVILSSRIQKLGLALAGFSHYVREGRIQIVGQSEISYLRQLDSSKRIEAIRNLDLAKICCLLITKNLDPPVELVEFADRESVPILRTANLSSQTINDVARILQEILAPRVTLHGVMMGMYGIGVLLLGESGIGKSECALDLISRGHRLIADDSVLIKKIGGRLEGSSPEITREHLEIRGLGILNIRDLFGISAVSKNKKIQLIIELKRWDETEEIERVGMELKVEEFFGFDINKFTLPVSVGRNLSTLVETAARVYLMSISGVNAAQKLVEKHSEMLLAGRKSAVDR